MDPRITADRFGPLSTFASRDFFVVDQEPSAADSCRRTRKVALLVIRRQGQNAHRVSMDLPIAQDLIRTVESARGPAVKIPNSGGTDPDAAERVLHMPEISVPIGNHDNNQHSYNENLRLQNLWDGIELMAALLTM